jgi:hypothetical protein
VGLCLYVSGPARYGEIGYMRMELVNPIQGFGQILILLLNNSW